MKFAWRKNIDNFTAWNSAQIEIHLNEYREMFDEDKSAVEFDIYSIDLDN